MKLGVLSNSLNVKNLQASKEFYEKLGFMEFGGSEEMNYLIMKNGNALIGLFQGILDSNIITFNPGWDEIAHEVNPFTDVRDIQKELKAKGLKFDSEADETTEGPESFVLRDPDGNVILVDQHR